MAGSRRKLSFLSFAPEDSENSVLLDDQMEGVWNRSPLPGPSHRPVAISDSEPLLDVAAPRAPRRTWREPVASSYQSASDLSRSSPTQIDDEATSGASPSWVTVSEATRGPGSDRDRLVQFDSSVSGEPSAESPDGSEQSRYFDCESELDLDDYDSDLEGSDEELRSVLARLRKI